MPNAGYEQRDQLLSELKILIHRFVSMKAGLPADYTVNVPRYAVGKKNLLGQHYARQRGGEVTLAAWKFEKSEEQGVLEDGSLFAEATVTRRGIFSGKVKSVDEGVFRITLDRLSLEDMRTCIRTLKRVLP